MQGKTINGFELQRLIGVGGMAEVWLAENKLGKKAAVKMLLPKLCADDTVKSRFYTEAKLMVELSHPNIRQVYDFGDIDGRPAIVMEYLEGGDLKALMKQGRQLTETEITKWWDQLVDALTYTHRKGIIHRDIKPSNLFLDESGHVKLLDFGIAKVKESISMTQTGAMIGTLLYMSPEQVQDSKHLDYKTDIYSLAVTFVHLLSGKAPYDSTTSNDYAIRKGIVEQDLDLSGIPASWRGFLKPYLAKNPAERPELRPYDDSIGASFTNVAPSNVTVSSNVVASSYPAADETIAEVKPDSQLDKREIVSKQPESKQQEDKSETKKLWLKKGLIWLGIFVVFEFAVCYWGSRCAARWGEFYLNDSVYLAYLKTGLRLFLKSFLPMAAFVVLFNWLKKKTEFLPWIICILSLLFYCILFFAFKTII